MYIKRYRNADNSFQCNFGIISYTLKVGEGDEKIPPPWVYKNIVKGIGFVNCYFKVEKRQKLRGVRGGGVLKALLILTLIPSF